MSYSDEEIRDAVLKLMNKYDQNGNGYIEGGEKDRLLNDLKMELKVKKKMNDQEIFKTCSQLDKNQVGKITKD